MLYDAVIFDLDGTLTDSQPGIFACAKYALEKMNWPIPVMAVAGTVLLVVGCILLAGRKRAGHEE